jgi:hypothetical protein
MEIDKYALRSLPAPPPRHPLWDGIYSFPLRPANSRALVLLSFSLTFLALLGLGFHIVIGILNNIDADQSLGLGGDMVTAGARHVFIALVVFTFFASLFPANAFLVVAQGTGGGEDQMHWDVHAWYEWMASFLYMGWTGLISAMLGLAIVMLLATMISLSTIAWWLLLGGVSLVFFPLIIMSMMVGGSVFFIFHPHVLARCVTRPLVPLFIYVNTLLFAVPCLMLGYWLIFEHVWFLAPVVGVLWAVDWLCYARVIGRAGLVLCDDGSPRRPRRA